MGNPDLDRVTSDLRHLQQTLGLEHTADDPRVHALIAVSGIASLVWTLLVPAQWQFLGLLSVVLPIAYAGTRVRHPSPAVRRDLAEGLAVLATGIPILVYVFWAQRAGVPPLMVLATAVFFVGVMLLGGAKQRVYLCWGLAFMASALLIPTNLVSPIAAIALALVAGGSVSALIARGHHRSVA